MNQPHPGPAPVGRHGCRCPYLLNLPDVLRRLRLSALIAPDCPVHAASTPAERLPS